MRSSPNAKRGEGVEVDRDQRRPVKGLRRFFKEGKDRLKKRFQRPRGGQAKHESAEEQGREE